MYPEKPYQGLRNIALVFQVLAVLSVMFSVVFGLGYMLISDAHIGAAIMLLSAVWGAMLYAVAEVIRLAIDIADNIRRIAFLLEQMRGAERTNN